MINSAFLVFIVLHFISVFIRGSSITTIGDSTPGGNSNRSNISNVSTVTIASQIAEINLQESGINILRRTAEELSRNHEILRQKNKQLTVANRRLEEISARTQAVNELLERNAQVENTHRALQSQLAALDSNFDSRAHNMGIYYTGVICEMVQKHSNDLNELIHIANTSGSEDFVERLQRMRCLIRDSLAATSNRQGVIAHAQSVLGNPPGASGALPTVTTPSQPDNASRPAESDNGRVEMDQEVVDVQTYSNPAPSYEVALSYPASADIDLAAEMSDFTDDSHPVSQGF
ncbi:hypothetical protein QFC19_003764 [Naganishia cerealis]|uniref:Uncharacterized protein n=1 Tax=Naganishia cerealis TaxID=610337 RepID=A0ACC2W1K9_9TREE|nr:hypothetical protein QFC19_003764 [Naganishia cerealis]